MVWKGRNFFTVLSVTNLIVLTCVFVFFILLALSIFSINITDSLFLNAKYVFAKPWTLITHIFLHAGLFHLFVNMVSLVFLGGLVERIIGKNRFFFLFLLAGIAGGIFFVLAGLINVGFSLANLPDISAVGASGALFGLAGVLLFLTPNLPVFIMFIPIPVKMKYAIPLLLLFLWVVSLATGFPIGNSAHLGGFVAGMGYGLYLKRKYPNKVAVINRFFG